jgi:hypothetical protein
MGFEDLSRHLIVLRDCAMHPEQNGLLLRRKPCASQWAFDAFDPYIRDVR